MNNTNKPSYGDFCNCNWWLTDDIQESTAAFYTES